MSLAFLLALAATPPPVPTTARPDFVLEITCPEVAEAPLRELVNLEVAELTLSYSPPPPRVSLTCQNAEIVVVVADLATGRSVRRRFPRTRPDAPDTTASTDRELAVAIAEVIGTSWPFLLSLRPRPVAASSAGSRPAPPPPSRWSWAVSTWARARNLAEKSVPTGGVEVGIGGLPVPGLWLGGSVGFEGGRAARIAGTVDLVAARLSGVARALVPAGSRVALVADVALTTAWVRLTGRHHLESVIPGSIDGFTGEAALALGPAFTWARIRLLVQVEGGYGLRTPRGEVEREPGVTMGGGFVGGRLGVMIPVARR